MAKSKAKKLTSKELEDVKELQSDINNLLMNIGNAELVKNQLVNKHVVKQGEWQVLTSTLEEKYGQVNISLEDGSLSPMEEEVKEDYFVNIIAPLIMAQKMYKNKNIKNGKIINITDWKTAREKRFSYGISKAGVFGLTKSLAISMAPRFQVNEIALGAILPPVDSLNRIPKKIDLGPMKRVGEISEVTSCIEMLLKNDFITGEKINIDGGRHIF